ncbi:TPA: hypothetical protein ACGORO_000777 [Streptococcus suis]|uniref:hypothetical protein n=1 Tax=Streptococcus suis TaxID=1307 RepID=UPI00192E1F4F|nr:hypothetical protein [Streptococcus suis]QRA08136.1 hypothetical protein JM964_07425 [Streptococcus suis]QWS31553.1 hypothetical protein KPA27_02335 [Streptococcus suis]QXT27815.1 hypothetical protein KWY62_02325 [Streptococcus suis]UAJ07999.1 hypothetical protein JSY00_02345 [Streptococcus suis]HEM4047294.1 hypothetical protein [Streptococcus suis]
MNIYSWILIISGVALLFISALGAYFEALDKENQPSYTEEEIALVEYLEKKQVINGIYLEAVAEILRHQKR